MSNEPIEGQILETMPAPSASSGNLVATTTSPYMSMAMRAMELDKVDQLEKLMALHQQWEDNRAHKAYTAAMAAFKAEPIQIIKKKLVEFTTRDGDKTSYRHATMADVVDAVVPAMGKHGLSHRWDVHQNGQITVSCTITHRDGHSESVSMSAAPDASGKKNAIQQVASTVTYLQRYTLMALCGVAAADQNEDDGRGAEADTVYISEEQEVVLRDLIDAYVKNKAKFMDWISGRVGFTVTKLIEIPAEHYDTVHNQLAALRKESSDAS